MQAELGHDINQEIAGLCLNEATRLLRETNLKLESVAREVGYGSATYLCRVIQTSCGISPGEYREKWATDHFRGL